MTCGRLSGLALRDSVSRFLKGEEPRFGHTSSPRGFVRLQGAPAFCLLSSVFPQRGRAERWAFHRARGAMYVETHVDTPGVLRIEGAGQAACSLKHTAMAACLRQPPRKQEDACVPHATVLSACNSQRRHAPGALTECLASPHCWVLGPPTSPADHHPFTTSRKPCLDRPGCRTERPAVATGPSHPAPRRR
jgi:hypothetical protein